MNSPIASRAARSRPAPLVKAPDSSSRPLAEQVLHAVPAQPVELVHRPQHGQLLARVRDARLGQEAVQQLAAVDLQDIGAARQARRLEAGRRQGDHLRVRLRPRRADGVGVALDELAEPPRPRLLVCARPCRRRKRAERLGQGLPVLRGEPGERRGEVVAQGPSTAHCLHYLGRPAGRTRPRWDGRSRAGTCRARRRIRTPRCPAPRSRSARRRRRRRRGSPARRRGRARACRRSRGGRGPRAGKGSERSWRAPIGYGRGRQGRRGRVPSSLSLWEGRTGRRASPIRGLRGARGGTLLGQAAPARPAAAGQGMGTAVVMRGSASWRGAYNGTCRPRPERLGSGALSPHSGHPGEGRDPGVFDGVPES